MAHLSDWHNFDANDRSTYPKVSSPVQIKLDNGRMYEGDGLIFFPSVGHLPGSLIVNWRYIKNRAMK
jgi:hypothetical protein